MATESLRSLARHLEVPERTLRRAAAEGLIHGRRMSPRRFETSLREEAYLRLHWPLLSSLRAALRTEPNVRLAVLFGSQATGGGTERSDVDVLVALADASASRVAALADRLALRLDRPVQLVRLQDAERSPALMADALTHGRVLVDRDDGWPRLLSARARWQARAAEADTSLDEGLPDLRATE
jgi:predicted nucleotidyltransferase